MSEETRPLPPNAKGGGKTFSQTLSREKTKMKTQQILETFINFYKKRGHTEIQNVSLIPENDPTLLYVNSGMFPLVPYFDGEPHPNGTKLVNVQRALRFFEDLENVGNTIRHTTCFHMLGNWSLGEYFKEEQLNWVYELLIEELGLDPNRLYASVFKGDDDAPRDDDAIKILQSVFAKYGVNAKVGEKIFAYDKKENWWQRGDAIGELGGPDSEIFYYLGEGTGEGMDPAENDELFLEIGNSVFMQYKKTNSGWEELSQKNIDFGGGLERWALIKQGKSDIYETDNFWPVIEKIQEISGKKYDGIPEDKKAMRVIADHIRSATLLAMDGVKPSNKDQGYILRRLIRRMTRFGMELGIEENLTATLVGTAGDMLGWMYPQIKENKSEIESLFDAEEQKFLKAVSKGASKAEKILDSSDGVVKGLAKDGFDLYQSQGFPIELFIEGIKNRWPQIDEGEFDKEYNSLFKQHQQKSREGAEQKFKGGLADHSEQVVKYHTATHLLHWALRQLLGKEVVQHGSNITGERLRFDFNFDRKLTETEIEKLVGLINKQVDDSLNVGFEMMKKEDAEKTGAIHAFGEKYGEKVKVYYIGNSIDDCISKEFCGGPHVNNTSEIGHMQFKKQKKIGENLMRVYLEQA